MADIVSDPLEPDYEPEDCVCREELENNDIEYTKDFYPSDDGTYWICQHCGRHQ